MTKIAPKLIDYDKYELLQNVVDTSFTELGVSDIQPVVTSSVADLFVLYDELFYEIPKTGVNSHTSLVERSSQYVDYEQNNQTIQALLEEINSLRRDNADLVQQNLQLQSKLYTPDNMPVGISGNITQQ